MKLEILILLLFLCYSCESVTDSEYEVRMKLYSDKVDYFLLQDQLLIDSARYEVSHQIIDGRTPYQELDIDIVESGWSCTNLDSIILYNDKYLKGRFNFENKFLNTIIEAESLELPDSIQILNYWKEIFSTSLNISTDQDWINIVDTFYNKFVFNQTDSLKSNFHLDNCEIQMFMNVYEELKSKQNGVYYATTWFPYFLEEESIRKFNFDVKRLELKENKGVLNAKVSAGSFIKFR